MKPMKMEMKRFSATELRDFSLYSCVRNIASLVDGLKPGQRKVMFATAQKSIPETGIRVSQLAGFVSEIALYHHGEGSLQSTIVGMAQGFPGTNNIPYLMPLGQFGSRLNDVAAAARYIFTRLDERFRIYHKKDDDLILENLEEDGDKIEPKYYLPVLPMVLVNGTDGIGTGFKSRILPYSPAVLRDYILAYLRQEDLPRLEPWFKGFTGTVVRDDTTGQVVIQGKFERLNTTTIRVTELPIGETGVSYKERLLSLLEKGLIKDYDDASTEEAFDFTIVAPRTFVSLTDEELIKHLGLTTKITELFTVWDEADSICRFSGASALCDYFIQFRLKKYEDRRLKLIDVVSEQLDKNSEKIRFIELYLENAMPFSKKTKAELVQYLAEKDFKRIDDLLDIRLHTLTKDQLEKLRKEVEKIQKELDHLKKTNAKKMYIKELEELTF